MTQEYIELLATDISARVKHGVQVMLIENEETMERYKLYLKPYPLKPMTVLSFINYDVSGSKYKLNLGGDIVRLEDCKPYLRPMSDMSEEEKSEFNMFFLGAEPLDSDWSAYPMEYPTLYWFDAVTAIDWLNKKMFDHRTDDEGKTMIDKGIALEAPEGMYE